MARVEATPHAERIKGSGGANIFGAYCIHMVIDEPHIGSAKMAQINATIAEIDYMKILVLSVVGGVRKERIEGRDRYGSGSTDSAGEIDIFASSNPIPPLTAHGTRVEGTGPVDTVEDTGVVDIP